MLWWVLVSYVFEVLLAFNEVSKSGINDVATRRVIRVVTSHDLACLVKESLPVVCQFEASSIGCHESFKYLSMHGGWQCVVLK
jgi:hypothetical protein